MFIALWTVGFGLFLCGMPKYYDDYCFLEFLEPWFSSQDIVNPDGGGDFFAAGFPMSGILDTAVWHYLNDNGRLCNMLAPLLLVFPKWFGSGVMTLLLVWSVLLSLRFAGVSLRRSPLVALALFMWTFMLPWWEHMGSLVFQMNYIFSPWLVLLTLRVSMSERKLTGWRLVGLFLLSVTAGMSQEAFSVPVLASFVALVIIFRDLRSRRNLVLISGLMCGLLLLCLSPGTRGRIEFTLTEGVFDYSSFWASVVFSNGFAPAVFIITLVVAGMRSGWNRVASDPCVTFALVCMIVSLAMSCCVRQSGRTLWCMDLAAFTAALRLLRLLPGMKEYRTVANRVTAAVLMALTLTHLTFVDIEAFKCRKVVDQLADTYVRDPHARIFTDISMIGRRPVWCGRLPDWDFHVTAGLTMPLYYNHTPILGSEIKTLPVELRNYKSGMGEPLNDTPSIRNFNGLLLTDPDVAASFGSVNRRNEIMMRADYGKGYVPVTVIVTRFRSEVDGREYVWLYPCAGWYVTNFKQLQGLRIL